MPGRLFVGTSGFAYPGWAPRFYPAGLRGDGFLTHYASRLAAVELNNTFYQQPQPAKVAAWLAATPTTFRFVVKAQRGGTYRSFAEPTPGLPWLTDPYRAFGERLGAVLFRVPDGSRRDDARLAAFLSAWPRDLPLAMEFQDPGWHVDETFAALAAAGASLTTTELPEDGRRRPSAGPGSSWTCGYAATTIRRPSCPRGRPDWSRSSPTASMPSCSSAMTTAAADPSWRSSSRIGSRMWRRAPEGGRVAGGAGSVGAATIGR